KFKRYNLILNVDKYNENLKDLNLNNYKVIKATKEEMSKYKGVVVPKYFWNDNNIDKCQAFIVLNGEEEASIAFSSAIKGNVMEIGVETKEEYRRKGLVTVATKSLIEYCLENGYKPIWACKNENFGSANSANKLGFEKIYEGPYYEILSK
ncbi:MAG: GNAT family N-acetyltransferase, partial [Clostridium sp.]